MRKYIIAGNWKMHGSRAMVADLLGALKQAVSINEKVEMAVFPPAVFLEQTENLLRDSAIKWGGQNLATELQGAYTGEVSGNMLLEFGCHYVLIGHSERRALYNETNAVVAKKFLLAKQIGLSPVLCIGETLEQRQAGKTHEIVQQQLTSVMELAGGAEALRNTVIAYEPVWAIGTGLTATPEQAQEVHAALRQRIRAQDASLADQLRILYGGSLKAASAKALLAMPDIDGGLVGGASLDAQEFLQIYQSAY